MGFSSGNCAPLERRGCGLRHAFDRKAPRDRPPDQSIQHRRDCARASPQQNEPGRSKRV